MNVLDYLAGISTGFAAGMLFGEWIWRPGRKRRDRTSPPASETPGGAS